MLRCLVACGTEPTPGARAQEAARLIGQFLGDVCVVALASEDRRAFGPFLVESRTEAMTEVMRQAVDRADRERGAWPLAGRALISGEPVVIDRIRPGELEGIVNPGMDAYLARFGLSAVAFVAMRGESGTTGVIGMGRGPGRPPYARGDVEAAQRIADAVADDVHGGAGDLLTILLIDGVIGSAGPAERRFATPVERLTAGERIAVEYRMHARDGSVVWVRDESARVLDEHGSAGIAGIEADGAASAEEVRAIVAIARAAGRRTVAELVPDQETFELLSDMGVDLAQGFHVGRPRPLEEH